MEPLPNPDALDGMPRYRAHSLRVWAYRKAYRELRAAEVVIEEARDLLSQACAEAGLDVDGFAQMSLAMILHHYFAAQEEIWPDDIIEVEPEHGDWPGAINVWPPPESEE